MTDPYIMFEIRPDAPVAFPLGILADYIGLETRWDTLSIHISRDETSAENQRLEAATARAWRAFKQAGAITFRLYDGENRLASLHPPYDVSREAAQPRTLSPYIYLRGQGGDFVLACPLTPATLTIHDVGLLTALTHPPETPLDFAFWRLLDEGGFLSAAGDKNDWALPEVLFRQFTQFGMDSPAPQSVTPPPIVKPCMSDQTIPFDMPALPLNESFQAVLERRQSLRRHDDRQPITASELGACLYHAAHLKEWLKGATYDASRRPYPGAGALYELEIYPLVRLCEGLAPDLYHYCPSAHHLDKLNAAQGVLDLMLQEAAMMLGQPEHPPQVVLIITARWERLRWKYDHAAYDLILKDVGALHQTLYLVAAAMGLAPCALGYLSEGWFSTITGLNPLEEGVMGGFALGRP